MKIKYNPSIIDYRVLKSLTASQRASLIKQGLDIDKMEKALRNDLMKAAKPSAGQPVASVQRDRTNLVPVKKTVTRNGRQQLTTVWVNPDKAGNKDGQSDGQQAAQQQADKQSEQGGTGKEFVGSDGTRVSLKSSGNSEFPYTVTVTDSTGQRKIKRISSQKLAQQEVQNLVGNLDEASERAATQNISKESQGK